MSSSVSKASTPTLLLMTPRPKDLPHPVCLHPHLSQTHLENLVAFCILWWFFLMTVTFNESLYVSRVMESNPRGASSKSNLLPCLVPMSVTVPAVPAFFLPQDTAPLYPHPLPAEHHGLIFLPPTPQCFFQTCFSLSEFSHSGCVYLPLQLPKFILTGFYVGE